MLCLHVREHVWSGATITNPQTNSRIIQPHRMMRHMRKVSPKLISYFKSYQNKPSPYPFYINLIEQDYFRNVSQFILSFWHSSDFLYLIGFFSFKYFYPGTFFLFYPLCTCCLKSNLQQGNLSLKLLTYNGMNGNKTM